MIYSKETVNMHPISRRYGARVIVLLNSLLKKEGAKKDFFCTEVVLDIDQVEVLIKSSGGDRRETMDFAMGLSGNNMLLVEVKLNVLNPMNLKKRVLENKIRNSKAILGEDIPVLKDKVFLFNDNSIGLARRHLASLFSNNPNLKVQTITEFKEKYFLK